ncbi:MAG: sodium:solute symporter family protein [Candidatus Neomarinimicrobiota bacterium]|nr:MAG: sodium:solute symporter family protein [Candidatus Neomarinimicrobiota bacterium]
MQTLAPADWFILGLYLLLLYGAAFRRARRTRDTEDFILAGRRLSLPAFVATLVATWYGGILGVGENTFTYGIQTWFIFGLPYYVFALAFAYGIAPRIRQTPFRSIPDQFHQTAGPPARILAAVYIFLLASPAPYILSIGILLTFLFPLPLGPALLVAAVLSLLYIWFGGFGAVVRTDVIQFLFMFLGFFCLVGFAWKSFGSPLQLWQSLPPTHRDPTGGNTWSYLLVWFFIASWTFVDPGFYQRCAAGQTPAVARRGILWSILFWFVFDALTLLSGLYARAMLSTNQPLFAFPLLGAEVLPPVVLGVFLVGLLATIMSTIDSLGLISAITLGHDLPGRVPGTGDGKEIRRIRAGLVVSTFVALYLAWALPSVVRLWYVLGSLLIPGLLGPFLLSFSAWRLTGWEAFLQLLLPTLAAAVWWALPRLTALVLPGEPFFVGLGLSVLLIVLSILTRSFHPNPS